MRLRHIPTGMEITVCRNLYYTKFFKDLEYKDITPPRTQAQISVSEKFVRRGKLERTKANLQDVIRTFGPYHGIFLDAASGLDNLIKELKEH